MSPESILRQIKREASKATMRYQLGAVVVRGGRIISTGYNQHRHVDLPAAWSKREDTICAERDALRKCLHKAKGATVYVGKHTPGGRMRMARPCAACVAMMRDAGIKKIYYTDSNGNLVRYE
jgi:deoxycytidylate deaminase